MKCAPAMTNPYAALSFASFLMLASCTNENTSPLVETKELNPKTTPIISMYGYRGFSELNCKITLSPGNHRYDDTRCKHDWDWYFTIDYPQDGLWIKFYQDRECKDEKEGTATFKIEDPVYGTTTDLLSVDAGRGVPVNTELVPGIKTMSYVVGREVMTEQISCIKVVAG